MVYEKVQQGEVGVSMNASQTGVFLSAQNLELNHEEYASIVLNTKQIDRLIKKLQIAKKKLNEPMVLKLKM